MVFIEHLNHRMQLNTMPTQQAGHREPPVKVDVGPSRTTQLSRSVGLSPIALALREALSLGHETALITHVLLLEGIPLEQLSEQAVYLALLQSKEECEHLLFSPC